MINRIICCVLLLSLSACSFSLPGSSSESIKYYDLREPLQAVKVKGKDSAAAALVVSPVFASGYVDSQRILFSADGKAKGAYQFTRWTDRVTRQMQTAIIDVLSSNPRFATVSRVGSGTFGDYMLNTDVLEFYHNVSSRPGNVVVALRVEIVKMNGRKVLSSKHFRKTSKADGFNAQGAVNGLRNLTAELLAEVSLWAGDVVLNQDVVAEVVAVNEPVSEQ